MNPVQELSGATPTANLLTGSIDEYFQRTDSTGAANFLTDALGSTLALTNSTGSTLAQYTYEPFGNTTIAGSSTSTYQYTGRENDGTGLYYYRARYYSPTFQRFSEDPIRLFGGDFNFYGYAQQHPVNLADPFGLWTFQLGGTVGANIPVWGPAGFAGSLFAGIAYDGCHWAFYDGGGLGAGVGAGASGGVTIDASNAHSVCGLSGPFISVGASGGAGWGGGGEGFAGEDSHGNPVYGGNAMIGGAMGGSASLQGTYTWVHPLGGRYTCPK